MKVSTLLLCKKGKESVEIFDNFGEAEIAMKEARNKGTHEYGAVMSATGQYNTFGKRILKEKKEVKTLVIDELPEDLDLE